jgi:23S rRNA pseudouridine2457 synthase
VPEPLRYFLVNKPYDVLSQFVSTHPQRLLGDLGFAFPEGTHAIGRLDLHSEGLLILTTDSRITRLLFQGPKAHERTYLVQVKGIVKPETVEQLRTGISFISHGGQPYISAPCDVSVIPEPELAFPSPYIYNDHATYSWLRMSLTEGKFHQVRKMVRAVRHNCVRLVRTSIAGLHLGDMTAGEVREISQEAFFTALGMEIPPNS